MEYGLGLALSCSLRPLQEATTNAGGCWWGVPGGFAPLGEGDPAPLAPHMVSAQPWGSGSTSYLQENPKVHPAQGAVDSRSACLTARAKLGCFSTCR